LSCAITFLSPRTLLAFILDLLVLIELYIVDHDVKVDDVGWLSYTATIIINCDFKRQVTAILRSDQACLNLAFEEVRLGLAAHSLIVFLAGDGNLDAVLLLVSKLWRSER